MANATPNPNCEPIMPTVTAWVQTRPDKVETVTEKGKQVAKYRAELEITDDLPADAIGECVAEAVHKAWRAGNDPGLPPFRVFVTFGV